MDRTRFAVAGEQEHADRVLKTIEFLAERGRLCAASDLIEEVDLLDLTTRQRERLYELAEMVLDRIEAALQPAQPVYHLLASILPFRASNDLSRSRLRSKSARISGVT